MTDILAYRQYIDYDRKECYSLGESSEIMVLGEKRMGIWGFSEKICALLFLVLLIQTEKNPFIFPREAENPETFVAFPRIRQESGMLAIPFLQSFVGKWSAKTKRKY
ncbi:MAG: hypothetical protein IKW59_06015 [Clostridia bacterium]|nr:hypothetical protein [Clostridia bacterium]